LQLSLQHEQQQLPGCGSWLLLPCAAAYWQVQLLQHPLPHYLLLLLLLLAGPLLAPLLLLLQQPCWVFCAMAAAACCHLSQEACPSSE
jgi:hypothetical protein